MSCLASCDPKAEDLPLETDGKDSSRWSPCCSARLCTPIGEMLQLLLGDPTTVSDTYLCPAILHAHGIPPRRQHNGGHGVSKRSKCSSAGDEGSGIESWPLFWALFRMCMVILSITLDPCLSPHSLPCCGCFWSSLSLTGNLYSDLRNLMMIFSYQYKVCSN